MIIKTKDTKTPSKKDKTKRRPPKKITQTYLHNAGLYYLGRFAASSQRFREIMTRKIKKSCAVHEDQNIEECYALLESLITDFQRSGLLNDETYAASKVKTMRRQGKSRRAITSYLNGKGIEPEIQITTLHKADTAFETSEKDAEHAAAMIYAKKRKIGPFRTKTELSHEKELAALARAGFSYEIASNVLKASKDT